MVIIGNHLKLSLISVLGHHQDDLEHKMFTKQLVRTDRLVEDMIGVWNYPTRSRDDASSSDDNSDTGPDQPDRDRGATPPRTTADSPCAVRARSRSHVVPIL